MEIRVDSLIEGARRATGTVIIIDVYRAFTTASVAFEQGISKILFVATIEEALEAKASGVADYCVGEVNGIPLRDLILGIRPMNCRKLILPGK